MKKLYLLQVVFFITTNFLSAQTFTTSNLPIVIINTNGQTINDEPGIIVDIKIINNSSGVNNVADTPNEYNGKAKIEFRGCSSQNFPKKSFGIELRDATNTANDLDDDLFGFPAESDWVLNASYTDKSFMRESLAFHLSNLAGNYASRVKYVEVVLNGSYNGLYVFQEKIKRDDGRVPIKKLEITDIAEPKISGGYILKIDKGCGNEDVNWTSSYDSPYANANRRHGWAIDIPNENNLNSQQETYIRNFISAFETAAYGSSVCDQTNGYAKYINDATFIDQFLFQEVSSNSDGFRFSSFFYKDRNGLLNAGPIWDFNLAFGFLTDPMTGYTQNYQGWRFNYAGDKNFPVPFFWSRLLTCCTYQQKVADRYRELRQTVWKTADLMDFIDEQYAMMGASAYNRNFTKWTTLNTMIWSDQTSYVGGSVAAEVTYLKNWLTNRLNWMDSNITTIYTAANCNIALPVVFSDFEAREIEGNAALEWSTSSETNASHFEIEKSLDAKTFSSIGKQDAIGNSSVQNNYRFIDFSPSQGINYYRIRQIDTNGADALTNIKSVRIGKTDKNGPYPNPATDAFNLKNVEQGAVLTLTNSSGIVLKQISAQSSEVTINTQSYPDGMYILTVTSKFGIRKYHVLVKK